MRRADIRAFAHRDWRRVERLKDRYWAESELTPSAAIALGDDLRRFARAARPDWPSEEDRGEDLAVHRRVSESLRRVAAQRAG